jgi:hypothetical protein
MSLSNPNKFARLRGSDNLLCGPLRIAGILCGEANRPQPQSSPRETQSFAKEIQLL